MSTSPFTMRSIISALAWALLSCRDCHRSCSSIAVTLLVVLEDKPGIPAMDHFQLADVGSGVRVPDDTSILNYWMKKGHSTVPWLLLDIGGCSFARKPGLSLFKQLLWWIRSVAASSRVWLWMLYGTLMIFLLFVTWRTFLNEIPSASHPPNTVTG